MPSVQFYPFGRGAHQENDERIQEPGGPRAVENLRRTKNGRLCPIRDYETLGMTAQSGISDLRLYDLAGYGNRLLGFGRCTVSSEVVYAVDATDDIFDLVEEPSGTWRRAPTSELGSGTQPRYIGRIGRKGNSVTRMDVAAGGGRVCMVYETILRPDTGSTASVGVQVFDAETDTTLLMAGITGAERPRVVFVNGVFFIAYVITATGAIGLQSFTPATGSALVALTSPVGSGASVVAWDMVATVSANNTFWIGVARSDTTTALRGCNSAGTVTYTTAGPAVLGDAITVHHHDTGGTERLHVCIVRDTSLNVDLYTYLPPATTPAVSSTDLLTPLNALSQPGMCLNVGALGAASLKISFKVSTTGDQIVANSVNFTTHAVASFGELQRCNPIAKASNINGRVLTASLIPEDPLFSTNALIRICDTFNQNCYRPISVNDRFLGHQLDLFHLPSIAFDASTGLTYWATSAEDEDRIANPQILELKVSGSDRRQTAHLGDVLYIAGAIMQAFDGRAAQEAGGFLTRPVTDTGSASGGAGSLEADGVYQYIVVNEYRDAKNRRIQSAPSDLREVNAGALGEITITAINGLSLRDAGMADVFTPAEVQSVPTQVLYRTLDTLGGNGTFHIDISTLTPRYALKGRAQFTSTQSDTDISDNSILYTQGARGALSGPLEFVCPDGCTSLTASADRILSGGLPDETRVQESRPLFVAEQVQWSDTLGFYRDVRDRVLAVQRLDERRIIFTATEVFEADGSGLDDNGLGDIGAARRLPSDVGLYGGVLGWRSIVEMSAGILFQGLFNQIYLLPRGGVTPIPVGFAVEDTLAQYPVISAAVYMNEDQTVRFCCNNTGNTECIVLLFNVRFMEWFVEGPYAFGVRSAARAAGRFYMLTTLNTVLRQRTSDTPLAFVNNAWRSAPQHPWGPGMFGRFDAVWFYGTVRGDCQIRCIVEYDERDTEISEWIDVVGRDVGSQFVHQFTFNQMRCESVTVDFEVRAFQNRATPGLDYTYWAIEGESGKIPNQLGPEDMT